MKAKLIALLSLGTAILCVPLLHPKPLVQKVEPIKPQNVKKTEDISRHYQPIWAHNRKLASLLESRKKMAEALQCLADNIYNEAAFEPTEGQLGVATVTLNRVNMPGYPNTVCGVVYERHMDRHSHKVVCQFSWTCKRAAKRLRKKYEEVRQVAKEALFKHIRLAELEGVTLYHADYIHPDWADKESPVIQIGRHIFYKEQL